MNKHSSFLLALLLLAGCAAAPIVQTPVSPVAYAPSPAQTRIAGSATIEATYEPAPEQLAKWKKQGFKDKVLDRHRQEVANALANDLANCGLFTRILSAAGDAKPDYIIRIQGRTIQLPTHMLDRVTLVVINGATGNTEWTLAREMPVGPINGPHTQLSLALPRITASLKSDLANAIVRKTRDEAERAELARMQSAPLADLLASSDRNTIIARERNHAIVAAKTQQLPGILRSWKTDQLSSLVVKIEQTILYLNHECEVAKDKAQQSVADGTNTSNSPEAVNDRAAAVMAMRGRGAPPAAQAGQGFLGINMAPSPDGIGVLVAAVVSGSPADQSGLVRSDTIIAADDQPMHTPQLLMDYIAKTPPGSIIRLKYRRGGAELSAAAVLSQRPTTTPSGSVDSLRDLSISYRERIELLKAILSALKEEIANRNR